jgi:hypothetical protein
MPIQVVCPCGNSFQLTDDSAGHKAKCPACGVKLFIRDDRVAEQPSQFDRSPLAKETGIEVHATFFPLAWMLFFVKPTVEIDGRADQVDWNQAEFFPLPPGQHEIKVYVNWIFGPTWVRWQRITVRPNRVMRLRYQHLMWWAEMHLD